jgi:hypothetical protein
MARLNLEERCFGEGRLRRLAKRMNWDDRMALGTLAMLWHESQAMSRTYGTREEIIDWCLEPNDSSIVDHLVACRYLDPIEVEGVKSPIFEIRGNERQIANLESYTRRARKGVEARKKAGFDASIPRPFDVSKKGQKQTSSQPEVNLRSTSSQPEDDPKSTSTRPGGHTIQFNSIQRISLPSTDVDGTQMPPAVAPNNGVTADDFKFAERWFVEHGRQVSKTVKFYQKEWAKTVRDLREIDGVSMDELSEMLTFVKNDPFWCKLSASLPRLRTKAANSEVLKYESIRFAMQRARGTEPPAPPPKDKYRAELTPEELEPRKYDPVAHKKLVEGLARFRRNASGT